MVTISTGAFSIESNRYSLYDSVLNAATFDSRLTCTDYRLLLLVIRSGGKAIKLLINDISNILNLSRRTIQTSISNLTKCGYLSRNTVYSNTGTTNIEYLYTIREDAGEKTCTPCEKLHPTPIIYNNNNTTTTIRENADNTMTVPTLNDIIDFAKNIHAKSDPERYFLIRSARGWKNKNGDSVTDWKIDFTLWNKNERRSAETRHEKKPKEKYYSGFMQRDHDNINFDDIYLNLDDYPLPEQLQK